MLIATLILVLIAAREIHFALWLARSARIRSLRRGLLVVEVRRRVGMLQLPSHVSAFPVPREERILVARLFGLVLWHRELSVALPSSACEHLGAVAPQDYDRQFPAWLRLAGGAA